MPLRLAMHGLPVLSLWLGPLSTCALLPTFAPTYTMQQSTIAMP